MKKIGIEDLKVLKAGLKHYKVHGGDDRDCCIECPMGKRNNRLHMKCYEFIKYLGGDRIFQETRVDQHDTIEYMINNSSSVRGIKI